MTTSTSEFHQVMKNHRERMCQSTYTPIDPLTHRPTGGIMLSKSIDSWRSWRRGFFFTFPCQVSAVREDVYNEGDIQERKNAD